MMILALEKEIPSETSLNFAPYLKSEARKVYELQQKGIIRDIWFHRDEHTAVILLECADLQEAQTLLATLPLVVAGLISFDLIPLVPYPGLERLFAK